MTNNNQNYVEAALKCLMILQLIMLGALFTKTVPYPPEAIPLFGMAPFIAVSISIVVAALIIGPLDNRVGKYLSVLAVLMAML
jgi:hypothetical protein